MQCFLAGVLILSQIISIFYCNRGNAYKNLLAVLDNNQIEVLEKVSKERLNIYLHGQGIGVFLGLILLYILRCKKEDKNKLCLTGCGVVMVIYLVTYFYYQLSPKSDYLIKYLNNPEQRMAWMNMSIHMRKCHIISILLGFVGYYILTININPIKI